MVLYERVSHVWTGDFVNKGNIRNSAAKLRGDVICDEVSANPRFLFIRSPLLAKCYRERARKQQWKPIWLNRRPHRRLRRRRRLLLLA